MEQENPRSAKTGRRADWFSLMPLSSPARSRQRSAKGKIPSSQVIQRDGGDDDGRDLDTKLGQVSWGME